MLTRHRPCLVLAALWLLYFHPLVLRPAAVLYADYSDFLAEHLPVRLLLTREWADRDGELPLWNPYHFCGTPLVHDIQAGVFYPPYAVSYLVPEARVGAVLSWVIALHVLLAGVLALAYARWRGLGEAGSLVAAAGFMLSAKWMTHLVLAGHTITVGLAWLPLVLLGLERGIRGSPWGVVTAGVGFALILLGTHTQWAFYAGVFAALWTLGPALGRDGPTARKVGRWLLCGVGAVAVAVPLTAVQLLPTWEASGQSSRAVGVQATQSLTAGVYNLLGLVGPTVGYLPPFTWEARGLLGAFWLAAAAAAPAVAGRAYRWPAAVLAGLIVFSVGGAALVDWLPGFNLFRIPSRMLLVAVFPVAFLAGVTTDALVRSGWEAAGRRTLLRYVVGAVFLAGVPSLAFAFVLHRQNGGGPMWGPFAAYWAVVVAGGGAVALACLSPRGAPRVRTAVWVVVLVAEQLAPTAAFPDVRRQQDIYPPRGPIATLKVLHVSDNRVTDIDSGTGPTDRFAPLGGGSPLAVVAGVETVRGYNPLDVRHFREYVGFVAGLDEPVLALSPVAQPVIPNYPRTNRALFDLMNVRYLVCFEEYVTNPEMQADPGHRLDAATWKLAAVDPYPPAVPALPPHRPDPLPRVLIVENLTARPRAFVVPRAEAMPAGKELAALTTTDLHTTVLLTTADPLPPPPNGPISKVRGVSHRPNRVGVGLEPGAGGFLVLSDVWFPGWVCRVDGVEVPVYRANHAFRAVALPAGAKAAVFTFEPRSYRVGWWVSAVSLGLLAVFALGRVVRWQIGRIGGTGVSPVRRSTMTGETPVPPGNPAAENRDGGPAGFRGESA